MEKGKKVLIPGSFDPITIGHYDVIRRAAEIFPEVYVTVFINGEKAISKSGLFTPEQRLEMIRLSVSEIPNVHAEMCNYLMADYMHEKGIYLIAKGVRGVLDFDYETSLYSIMRSFDNDFDTIFIPSDPVYAHVSSTYVRELIKYNWDLSAAVPAGALDFMKSIIEQKK